jgi:16S rRNA (cytosine967-C5)-methyltransferase
MTPAARLAAAIIILDRILSGSPLEQALTGWARGNRFAGSGDRAAIRDHVFDVQRMQRSCGHLGGGSDGRALVLGLLRAQGVDPDTIFTGDGHAPAPLTLTERAYIPPPMPDPVALDCPDWLWPAMQSSLGPDCAPVLRLLQTRAPVFLRVNLGRADLARAVAVLASDGIGAQPHPLAPTALEVTENARQIRNSRAYLDGLVELQDAASQAIITALPPLRGLRVLDYCAGGGGKALALAALGAQVTAHDANPARMQDIGPRAARAGVRIATATQPKGAFDLVLTDAPCSGSGSWRRAPAGKWLLTESGLSDLLVLQAKILDKAAKHVRAGGILAYATCSLLQAENDTQIELFLTRNNRFAHVSRHKFTPLDGGDGFFLCVMRAES